MNKNDVVEVVIEDIGVGGEGIGKIDGYTLFIKDAVIGDTVRAKVIKAKKSYGYARLLDVIVPSVHRVEPFCPVARQCGGCQLQTLSYEQQLEYKRKKVEGNLRRIGGFTELPELEIVGMEEPGHYRNKAQFPVGKDKEGNLITGFYAGRTHTIIPNMDCALGMPGNEEILKRVIRFMRVYRIKPYDEAAHTGLVRHILIRYGRRTGQWMVCLVINGHGIRKTEKLAESLCEIPGMTSITYSVNTEKTNVIMGNELHIIWGQDHITDYIGEIQYQISPLSFFQVNPVQTEVLYGLALEFAGLTGKETVWDLYCGIGTISLFLAQRAKQVYGVEIIPQAIDDARNNAKLNGFANVEFFVGKAEEVLPQQYEKTKIHADVIVVDPPRRGCDETLLRTMVEMEPERIVYVSCDPATLARDLKYLCGHGYELIRAKAVDMFPMTVHVETIVLLSHKSPDSTINVRVEFGEGEGKVPLDAIAERAKKYQPKPKITYKMIQEYVEKKYGFRVHTAYIAEVKRSLGLTTYDAPNAVEKLKQPRKHPPKEKVEAIKDTLKFFDVI